MFDNIEARHDYVEAFKTIVETFGGVHRKKEKYVMRVNTNFQLNDSGAYYGCISEDEEHSGAYSDLSVVVFPSNEDEELSDRWLIALVVGSLGFKNDYQLASLPGTRRMFVNSLSKDSFIKNDFLDIESKDGFKSFCEQVDENGNNILPETLKKAVDKYSQVILTCSLINPNNIEESEIIIRTYLAIYATLRQWATNNAQKKAIQKAMKSRKGDIDEKKEIIELLERRRYVVLQGAPGTGKTRMAKNIVAAAPNVFFTQFHAETTYSDFVYGILPNVNGKELSYQPKRGVFVQAVEKALEVKQSGERVYLIIDEINRANLSNVLGQAFYLFEPSMTGSNVKVEICPGLTINKLPDNLYVIATMNTADRSLAVVDFALRRRFAWYTMYPHKIEADNGMQFCEDEFDSIAGIFERYATDEELTLQPGQAYFVVSKTNFQQEIKQRLKYEIMPLIKEYFNAGMLARAKDDFVNYFREKIDEEMYR